MSPHRLRSAALHLPTRRSERGISQYSDRLLAEAIYAIAQGNGLEPKAFFKVVCQALVAKDQGARLASFILTVGKERIVHILSVY